MNFIEIISVFLFILLVFVGENFYNVCGFPFTYHQYVMALSSICIVFSACWDHRFFNRYENKLVLSVILLDLIVIYAFNGTHAIFWSVFQLYGAFFIYSYFRLFYQNKNTQVCTLLFTMLLLFYIIETTVAIYEKLAGEFLFGHATGDDIILIFGTDESEFRSTSFLGHPLQNALVVSTMMTFILTSSLKEKYKYSLWILGYFAILCFNTRSSMVFNIVVLFSYIIYLACSAKERTKPIHIFYYFAFVLFIFLGIYLIINNTSIGGRLVNLGLFDDSSAKARIDVFNIFQNGSINSFLFPLDEATATHLRKAAKLATIENFWVYWLFNYGLILLVINIPIMWVYIKSTYKSYSKLSFYFTMWTFLILSSTNNSLSASYIPTAFFLLCILLFSSRNEKYIPKKLRKCKRIKDMQIKLLLIKVLREHDS